MLAVTRSQGSPMVANKTVGKRSKVWNYFKQVNVNAILKAECLDDACKIQLVIPNMSTTSLRRHLYNVHQLNEFKMSNKDLHGNRKKKLAPHVKKQLDKLIIEAVVRDARSFTDFDKPGLKKFLQFALLEYKPPHRHTIQSNIKRLHTGHVKAMTDNLSKISSIAITTDFWSDKKQNSYMVLTGHYINDDFYQKSTVLQFSTFPKRHHSPIIGREIEKQLNELNVFDKISSITCDGAPNMVASFNYLSRPDVDRIQCLAHKIHLIICNGLGIWLKRVATIHEDRTTIIDVDEHLSQTVRKIKIDENIEDEQQDDDEEDQEDTDGSIHDDDGQESSAATATTDNSRSDDQVEDEDEDEDEDDEDDEDDIDDNFEQGVNTDDSAELPVEINQEVHLKTD